VDEKKNTPFQLVKQWHKIVEKNNSLLKEKQSTERARKKPPYFSVASKSKPLVNLVRRILEFHRCTEPRREGVDGK